MFRPTRSFTGSWKHVLSPDYEPKTIAYVEKKFYGKLPVREGYDVWKSEEKTMKILDFQGCKKGAQASSFLVWDL